MNGRTGLARKVYLSRLNVVGLTKLESWAMERLMSDVCFSMELIVRVDFAIYLSLTNGINDGAKNN